MSPLDWLAFFAHYLGLSLLAIGGAITTAPEMQRWLVNERGWLTDPQFSASIAIAQAAPGPNVLFIALLGWNVGVNAGGGLAAGWPAAALGLLGVVAAMGGILLPSTTLTFLATRWAHRNRQRRVVRAFKQGMAPVVIGLMVATGIVLARPAGGAAAWLLAGATALLVWRTKVHLLVLLGAGAVAGVAGFV